jgi:predicted transcriptional regulator
LCRKVLHLAAQRGDMASKNRLTVNLSDQEFSALVDLADRAKVSKAWLGRKAISELLERAQRDEQQLPLPLAGVKRGKRNENFG